MAKSERDNLNHFTGFRHEWKCTYYTCKTVTLQQHWCMFRLHAEYCDRKICPLTVKQLFCLDIRGRQSFMLLKAIFIWGSFWKMSIGLYFTPLSCLILALDLTLGEDHTREKKIEEIFFLNCWGSSWSQPCPLHSITLQIFPPTTPHRSWWQLTWWIWLFVVVVLRVRG